MWKLSPLPKAIKFQEDHSKGTFMLEVFFDWQGIKHLVFIPQGATVNKERYKEVLPHLWEAICLKCPEIWVAKDWVLLRDNVLVYWSLLLQQKIAKQVL
jgi:hypothetical protein